MPLDGRDAREDVLRCNAQLHFFLGFPHSGFCRCSVLEFFRGTEQKLVDIPIDCMVDINGIRRPAYAADLAKHHGLFFYHHNGYDDFNQKSGQSRTVLVGLVGEKALESLN